ncbi:MAG: InlB B-repeat-containing protein [Luteolibacter sp.]|nr:InlB B-repeat-containing protein [Luteolibacter sp.]
MKRFLTFLLLLTSLVAQAGVVFEQPHDGSGALRMSSRYQPNGTDYDQFVWDSFSVPTAQAVTEIRWRGGYDPQMAYWGGDIVNFRVSIYESTPGLSQPHLGPGYPGTPATLIAYDTGNKAGETSAGVFGGVEMFDYHFVLPTVFQAQAGKLYWVQIEAGFDNGLPYWGFAAGTGNGSHFRRIAGQADFYFQYAPGDAAFSILTNDGPTYAIAASESPSDSGTILNAGLYPQNAAAPLIATPNAGFAFVNWTENGTVVSTNPNYTFTVTEDRTLVANFATGSLITTNSSPLTGGNTDGSGSFVNGSSVTVQATPSANYNFVNWTENGVLVSASASYTFTAAGDRDLVANFTSSASNLGIVFSQPPTTSGTLLLSSYMLPDGNVDGMEYRFEKFTLATTTGISHLRWRGGYIGNNAAANPVVEFIIKIYGSTANGFYPDLANPHLKKYTVTGNANQTAAELVGGVQMYDYSVTLPTSFVATAGVGYWIQIEASQYGYPLTWGHATGAGGNNAHYRRLGNSYYSGTGDLALTLSADVPTSYAIAATSSSVNGGSVSGAGTFALDAVVNLSATAQTGYAFVNWTEGGAVVSSSALYSFSAAEDRSIVANFQPSYPLALTSSSTTMGTVAGAGTFIIGSSVTATATAKPGYVFLNWSEAGNIVSTTPAYTFTLLNQRTLLANFAAGFTVTTTPSFAPGGSVSGGGGYATGGVVTLLATPATGYRFTGWSESGAMVSASNSISFNATANRTLIANFVPIVGIVNTTPGMIGFAWPASAAGWVLQESTDLSPESWVNSSLPIITSGGQNQVSIIHPTGKLFFRLVHP